MTTESKFETVDGYTIVDIAEASQLVGPIRSAKKVLQRTTTDLVRHATYTCAVHGLDAAGAAAAVNYDRTSETEPPFENFANELSSWAASSNFAGSVNLGLSPEESGRTLAETASRIAETTAISAVASVPDGVASIVIASSEDEPELIAALGSRQFTQEPDLAKALQSGAHALLVRGKTGVLDHAVLGGTDVKSIIGLQPLTMTARGLAVANRAGVLTVPDFICAAGPTLAALGLTNEEIALETKRALISLADTGDLRQLFITACERAEAHLATMTDAPPFGRPLAP